MDIEKAYTGVYSVNLTFGDETSAGVQLTITETSSQVIPFASESLLLVECISGVPDTARLLEHLC